MLGYREARLGYIPIEPGCDDEPAVEGEGFEVVDVEDDDDEGDDEDEVVVVVVTIDWTP